MTINDLHDPAGRTEDVSRGVAGVLVSMNEDSRSYDQHIDGAIQIVAMVAGAAGLDWGAAARWLDTNRETINGAITDELEARGIVIR